MSIYCPARCPKKGCNGTCYYPSNHAHNLGINEHTCNQNEKHKWPVPRPVSKDD